MTETNQAPALPGGPTAQRGRLADAAGSILSLIVVLRRSQNLDAFGELRRTVEKMFTEFRSRARDVGCSPGDIDDACYALAGTIDELLLTARWRGRDDWQANQLARTYCNNEFVGIGFYDKLAQIRRGTPPRPDVLEVFYYCIVSGFLGKMVEDPKGLADLVDELSKEIAPPVKALAPNAYPQSEGRLAPMRGFPLWAIIVTAVCIPLIFWLVALNMLDGSANRILAVLSGN